MLRAKSVKCSAKVTEDHLQCLGLLDVLKDIKRITDSNIDNFTKIIQRLIILSICSLIRFLLNS